ncbi:MAG: methionyl-tRNA formyltransferase [Alcanivoracaceae bacterium]|nr:methionyl-tRNA formyltransferase [Alcanivoracaceae bacterium]
MKILFAGTPDFAATALRALLDSEHQLLAVLTQPDRPAGRGKKLTPSPVKQLAVEHDIPVLQPETLKGDAMRAELAALQPDVMVVVAYGLLIPQAILDIPRYGCINIHGSLLPRWRGAAPIQRAIEVGDTETGVGIMQMEAGLDTGPVLLEKRTPISDTDTGGSVHDRLAALGAEALIEALRDLPTLQESATVQATDGITYAHKLGKDDARIDWQRPAIELFNMIRAFNPWPVAWSTLDDAPVKIWRAQVIDAHGKPGEVLAASDAGVDVACGDGALRLMEIQLPGKRAMPVADVLRGHARLFVPGTVFSHGG